MIDNSSGSEKQFIFKNCIQGYPQQKTYLFDGDENLRLSNLFIYFQYLQNLNNMTQKSTIEQDKQRSELLKKQLNQMNEDFEFMKKNRDEWKKQLDARFQDIQRKIQSSKQFITNEAKRTNDTLLAFQHKFQHQLSITKDELSGKINNLSQSTDQRFQQKTQEIQDLRKNLNEQKKQRMHQHEEGMKDTRQKIGKLTQGLQKQKEARIKSQKQNMGKINESLFVLKEQLKQQKDERNLKLNELQKYTDTELSSQRKFNEQFHNKCFNDFKNSLDQLKNEMNARFSSKDQIINSISKVVRTLQETLRHPN